MSPLTNKTPFLSNYRHTEKTTVINMHCFTARSRTCHSQTVVFQNTSYKTEMKIIQGVLVYNQKIKKYTTCMSSTGVRTARCVCGERYKKMVKRLKKKRQRFLVKWVVTPVLNEETSATGFCSAESNKESGVDTLVKTTQVADTVHREADELVPKKRPASRNYSSQRSRPAKRKRRQNRTSDEKKDVGRMEARRAKENKETRHLSLATSRGLKNEKRELKNKGENGKFQERKVEIKKAVTRKRFKEGGRGEGEVTLSRYLYQLLQSGCMCPQVDLIVRLIAGKGDGTLRLVVSDERLSMLPEAWENLTEQGHSLLEVVQFVTTRATVPQVRNSSLLLLGKILSLEALSEKRVYVVVSAGSYDWALSARTYEDEARVVEDLVLFKSELERLGRDSFPCREVVVVLCPLVEAAVWGGRGEGGEEKKGELWKNERKKGERKSNGKKEEEGRRMEGDGGGRFEGNRRTGAVESMKRRNKETRRDEKEAREHLGTSSALKRMNRNLRRENASLKVPISTSSPRPWKRIMRKLSDALCRFAEPELQEDSSRGVCRILNDIFDACAE
ncbi:uncharacterized protein LOC125045871 isoform X2 [Penaeus chinensis]|uniref:uncharacterized protein LOC125045871 isoform X2 n=1 Tax=Penaeus chinensis TaxID=139456 RepID=UPI001FB5C351|nr:uncharacterized protein LOC125045871 isoform X2 [Penaeus chinensis]